MCAHTSTHSPHTQTHTGVHAEYVFKWAHEQQTMWELPAAGAPPAAIDIFLWQPAAWPAVPRPPPVRPSWLFFGTCIMLFVPRVNVVLISFAYRNRQTNGMEWQYACVLCCVCRKQNYVVTRLLPSGQDYYCDWTPSLLMLYIYICINIYRTPWRFNWCHFKAYAVVNYSRLPTTFSSSMHWR